MKIFLKPTPPLSAEGTKEILATLENPGRSSAAVIKRVNELKRVLEKKTAKVQNELTLSKNMSS